MLHDSQYPLASSGATQRLHFSSQKSNTCTIVLLCIVDCLASLMLDGLLPLCAAHALCRRCRS